MRVPISLNPAISIVSILLLSLGVLTIYSSSPQLAIYQLTFAIIGLILYIFISQFNYEYIKGLIIPLYLISLLLLLIVLFFGVESRGAIRWIPLGIFNIQPSEFAKPVIVLVLAFFWSINPPTWFNILKSLGFTLPISALIFKQPDLGSSLTIMAVWAGMLYAAKVSIKKMLIIFFLVAMIIPLSWSSLHDYQKQRVYSFLSPSTDPLGMGYNIIQSTIAVGSGELFGRGLGRGTQSRLQFLPEFRTDFIFASMAEELGFIGSILILILYFTLILACIKIGSGSGDSLGYLIVFGVLSMLLFQVIINIGMNIGIFPITGITLPLLSYGGSSLISTFILLGLVESVSKFKKKFDMDHSISIES